MTFWRKKTAAVRPVEPAGFAAAWRLTTFALVFVGFLALAATGEINPVAIALFVASWAFGLASSGSPKWWRPWMAWPLTWVPLAVITIIVLLGRFESLLYLLMFLGLYKCSTLRDPGDHMQALLMAFFMLLACTIITHSASYLGFILVFLVLTTLDLCFMTIAREAERSAGDARTKSPAAQTPRELGGRLTRDAIGYGLFMLLLGYFLFLVMPHYSLESRFSPNPFTATPRESTEAVSGYDDELTLKNLNNIRLDERRVMDVSVSWLPEGIDLPLPNALYLRGVVLNQFDGVRWTQSKQLGNDWVSEQWREINFAQPSGVLLEQVIRQDLNQAERLFAVPMPVQFSNLPRGYSVQMNYLTWALKLSRYPDFMHRRHNIEYRVISQPQPDATRILEAAARRPGLKAPPGENKWLSDEQYRKLLHRLDRSDGLRLSDEEFRINTRLPSDPITDVVMGLSQRQATAASDPDKILQLLGWMRSNFEYTLQPGTGGGKRPLETFLTETRRGHCEYFASAFVLLLRAQRIPARVALGFYTGEWDPEKKVFVVCQSDAHAWAEVWLNDYGWLTVDPTPPTNRGRWSVLHERAGGWARTRGLLRQIWQRYVLDYSSNEQMSLMRNAMSSRLGRSLAGAWRSLSEKMGGRLSLPTQGRSYFTDWLRVGLWLLVPVSIVAAAVAATALVARRLWRRRRLKKIYRSPVGFMNALLAALGARGWHRRPDQTIAEFARQVQAQSAWNLEPVLELYHACRFAGRTLTSREEATARRLVRRIQRAK